MAVSYVWPLSLPQLVTIDYSEDGGALIVRTPMDKGPAKQRRLGRRPEVMTVSVSMSDAQVATFEAFVRDTLKSTARFGFPHPRRRVQAEVRIVPESGGKQYDISYLAPNLWLVKLSIEVLP